MLTGETRLLGADAEFSTPPGIDSEAPGEADVRRAIAALDNDFASNARLLCEYLERYRDRATNDGAGDKSISVPVLEDDAVLEPRVEIFP